MKFKPTFIASMMTGLGIALAGAAHAGVSINIGGAPAPVMAAPVSPLAPVTETVGWHGDRYYDGHRMWDRKEWEAHQRVDAHRDMRADEHARLEARRRDQRGQYEAVRHEEHARNEAERHDPRAFPRHN